MSSIATHGFVSWYSYPKSRTNRLINVDIGNQIMSSNYQLLTLFLINCSRQAHNSHSKSLLQSPSKLYTSTPSLSHKKSTKTPKEKRRSSKTDILSPSAEKAATQWYTSDSDISGTQLSNGSTTIFELTQEVRQL